MTDLNSWSATGRLTRDAELKEVNGKKLLIFYVAINSGYKENQTTIFAKLLKWGNGCETVYPYLKKGKMVSFTGAIKLETYTAKNNETYTDLVVSVDKFNIINIGSKEREPEEPEEDVDVGDIE